jgi:hypothetical protein
MATLEISEELYGRVKEFQAVIKAVLDEDISCEAAGELVLQQGLDSLMANLFGPQGAGVMLQTLQQLAAKYPKEIYRFIAETIDAGEIEIEKERVRSQLGFHAPPEGPAG